MREVKNRVLKGRQRREFDPSNAADCQRLADFLKNMKWGHDGCPFEPEDHWQDIPTMLVYKYSRHCLGVE